MIDQFGLTLNLHDWSALTDIATKDGYPNTREWINAKLIEANKSLQHIVKQCDGKKKKSKNIYPIPEEARQTFAFLACSHSTSISSIIFRYVILPEILKHYHLLDETFNIGIDLLNERMSKEDFKKVLTGILHRLD